MAVAAELPAVCCSSTALLNMFHNRCGTRNLTKCAIDEANTVALEAAALLWQHRAGTCYEYVLPLQVAKCAPRSMHTCMHAHVTHTIDVTLRSHTGLGVSSHVGLDHTAPFSTASELPPPSRLTAWMAPKSRSTCTQIMCDRGDATE